MKKLLLIIAASFLLIGCNTKNNSSIASNTSISEESSVSSEPHELEEKTISYTFKTETSDKTWPGGGLGDGDHVSTFVNKLNENVELFSGLTQQTTFFNNNSEFKTWIYGNQTSGGYAEFTTNFQVIKIEVEVQTYYKTYNQTTNFDGETIFSVQDQEIDLRTESVVGSSEIKKQAFDFKDGLTTFRFTSTGGRTFLNKLTITYLG